jgi:integrase
LEWENIDFENKVVRICDKPHVLINGEPFRCKWGSSRVIPLKQGVIDNLLKLDRKSQWVFQNKLGNNLFNNLLRRFRSALKKTKIVRSSEVCIHTLRHTWISHLLNNGTSLKQVSVMAGHKN